MLLALLYAVFICPTGLASAQQRQKQNLRSQSLNPNTAGGGLSAPHEGDARRHQARQHPHVRQRRRRRCVAGWLDSSGHAAPAALKILHVRTACCSQHCSSRNSQERNLLVLDDKVFNGRADSVSTCNPCSERLWVCYARRRRADTLVRDARLPGARDDGPQRPLQVRNGIRQPAHTHSGRLAFFSWLCQCRARRRWWGLEIYTRHI